MILGHNVFFDDCDELAHEGIAAVCLDNPIEFIGPVRAGGKSEQKRSEQKRPFTLAELQAILAIADPEWRSLILFGLYTGQRLSDLVTLGWNNIDLELGEVRLVTGKTNRRMIIPMAPVLRSHNESLRQATSPSPDTSARFCHSDPYRGRQRNFTGVYLFPTL